MLGFSATIIGSFHCVIVHMYILASTSAFSLKLPSEDPACKEY